MFYQIEHWVTKWPRQKGLISRSWLSRSQDSGLLVEVLRYTPEFGYTRSTAGRIWSESFLLDQKDIKVTTMEVLPDVVVEYIPK